MFSYNGTMTSSEAYRTDLSEWWSKGDDPLQQ